MNDEKRHPVDPAITELMKPPGYWRPVIDSELDEPDVDLEFKVRTYEYHRDVARESDATIQGWLNDGWQIDDKIVCPPFVTLILSREKETTDE